MERCLALKGNTRNFYKMTVNVQFVKIASSETRAACVSKKLERLTEKYDW
jgi:hypothetical protein